MSLPMRLSSKSDNTPDITSNLPSLLFASALTPEQTAILYLRARSHAIAVTLCAQATFFIDVFNEGRQLRKQLKIRQKRTTRLLQDFSPKDPMSIGVIGCGHIGSQIVHCLLTYGRVNPDELCISTRRPETLEYFQNKGVQCYFNNVKLASSVNVVFLCVLPSQLAAVADEIKECLSPSCIVFCPVSSVTTRKLKQMLQTSNILQPDFHWDMKNKHSNYEYQMKVSSALENRDTVERTNPFTSETEDSIIIPSRNFGDVLLHCFINTCSEGGITTEESLEVLHWAMFGETEKEPLPNQLQVEDFACSSSNEHQKFPMFDLVEVSENGSPLSTKIKQNSELQQSFSKRYWEVFEQYIHLNSYGHM